MITSFIFDKTFDDLLENTKELEPIQTNRTKKEYKKYIENLKRVFKSYYNLTQGAKDDLALKPTDIMLKYEQYFESRESEINEFYNVFEKEFEAQLSFAKEENIRISKNMGVKNPTGNIGEAKISLIFDDVFYKTLEEKKGFKELINWDEIKKNKKDEKLNYKIQPLDYVFVWPYDDKIIKNNKIKNFYQSNINKTKSYKFIENLRKGFKAYYKGRFVTGRGLTDSPADYVVYDEKLEITKNGEKVFDTSERMKENSFGEDIERTKTVTKNVEIDYKDLINKYIKEVSPNNDNKNEYLKTLEMFKNNFQNKPQTGFEEELFNLIEGTERKLKLFLEELYENEHINDYNNLKAIQEQTIRIQLEIFDYQKKFKKSKFSNLFYEALNHQIDLNKKPEQSIYKIDFANIDVKGLNRQSKLLGFINYVLTTNTDELQYKAGTSEKYIGKSTTILNKIKTEKIKSIDDYNDLKNILLNIIQSEGEYSNVDFTAKDFDNLPSFFILDNFFNITSNKTITKESIGKISALQGIYNFFEIAKGNKNAKRIKKNIEELKKLFGQLSGNNNSISILGFKLITNLNKEVKNKTFDFENALKETFGNAVYITDSDFFNYLTEKEFDPSKIVYLDENAYINGEESQETISDNVYDEETLSDNIQDESTYHNNPESNQLNERQKEQEEIDRKRFNFLIGKRKASVEDPYKKEDIEPLNKDVKNIITAKIDNIMQEMVLQKQNTPQSKPIVQDTNIQQNQGKQNQEVVNTIQNLPAQSNSNIKNQSKNTNPNASISTNGTQPTVTSVAQTSKSLSKQNKTLANTQKQITNKTQGKETIKQFSEFKSIGIYSQLIYFTKLYFAEDIMLLKENGFDNYFFQNLTDGRKTDIDSFLDTFIELSELKKVMNNMESKRSELNQVMNNQKSQSSNFRMTEFKDSKTGKNLIYDSITKKLYKNGNDFISKNKNALKTDAYRMFDYIKYGKIKTQDAFGNDIKKSLADLIYEYNDILKEKDYNPSKLYYSEKEHMNKNIKLFVEQLVNKKFDEFGGKVLGQGKKQINQNQFYKQLELMKKIYDVTSLFFNKPKWKNMDALLCFSNEKDAIIKEEIFNSYFKLGIEIQKKAEMNEQEQQQLYIKLFEYFIDKNDLNKVNLKDKKELFNVIDFYNETKKLNKQENRQKNILRDIYSREKTSYILLDNKKYFIKTDFEKVRITDIDKEEQIFDINNPIKIKEKEYKVGIKNGFISFIRQSDNEEIIEEIIPEHDYGEITIGKKVYTIIDDKHLIRYLVDEKGGKNLYQLPDKDGAIIKQLKLSDQMQTNTLDKNYKTNFYKKQLYDFQEMYKQPKQKNFMMSFLYSYLQIKKNNDEQFNNAMENKEFINKIINKTLGTNDRDYIQETELFINKFKENNKILFDGIEYTIFDQEESAIEILKEKYKNINNLFYYNKKETIIINSLELQNDLQIKVNMSVINKFKDENILGNETKLKKHIEDLIDNINKAKDEKEKQDFIAELNKVLKSPKDTSTIDTSPLKNIVNKLQIISENEDSNKLKKFTDLKDNQYLEQLFAFKDIEKSFYIKDKNGEVMHLYNIKIQLSKESSRNANNNNINLLVERIEKEFEVERETAVYAADLILNGSITDRIFKQIIDKIKVDEKGNANEIEFEEKIVTRLEDIKQEIKDSVEKTKVSAEEIIEKDKEIFGEQASKTNFKIKKYQIFGAIQAGVQQTIGIGINQKIKQEQKQQSLYQTNTALKYNPSIDQELEEPNFGMTLFSDDYANNIITSVISGHGSDFIQDNIVVNLYNKRITRINNATN